MQTFPPPGERYAVAPAVEPSQEDRETADAIIRSFDRVLKAAADRGYKATFLNTAILDIEAKAMRTVRGIADGLPSPVASIVLSWLRARRLETQGAIEESLRLARAL